MSYKQGFELIDSGQGAKLERFGSRMITRPSSVAVWRREYEEEWDRADAYYDPKAGWSTMLAPWKCELLGVMLELRAQTNGQVGLFPEHSTVFDQIETAIEGKKARVLNLFAYTGLATIFAMSKGAEVTHIEISKKVLDWTNHNIGLNQVDRSLVRLIPEDAFAYLKRLVRKEEMFDLVIADPPSFSRIDKGESWQLEDKLVELMELLSKVVKKTLILSCHLPALGTAGLENLAWDHFPKAEKVETRNLEIHQNASKKRLPAGSAVIVRL